MDLRAICVKIHNNFNLLQVMGHIIQVFYNNSFVFSSGILNESINFLADYIYVAVIALTDVEPKSGSNQYCSCDNALI
jgi:hypothetical protein